MKITNSSAAASYSAGFYGEIADGSFRSAEIVLPLLFDLVHPESVVDVGCGVGTWLRAAQQLGAAEILGIDGNHVPRHLLEIDTAQFSGHNLEQPLALPSRRFDLAISLEVAEHLSRSRADGFVAELCELADVVLFSAAIPGQGGQEHVNEQWQSVWAQRFADHGYVTVDLVRPALWTNPDVEYWYKQNALVYIAPSRTDLIGADHSAATTLDLVHPTTWTRTSERLHRELVSQPGLRVATQQAAVAVHNTVRARVGRHLHRND